MRSLAAQVEGSGLRSFSKRELSLASDLFAQRAALFLTPTAALPSRWIGHGQLDVWIPLPVPSWLEYLEVPGYRSPRFWVDQIQRATGKIRWHPFKSACIQFIVYDTYPRGSEMTIKALLDALKQKSTGRRDGQTIHYFGAVVDDNWESLHRFDIIEEQVNAPRDIGCRIVVSESLSKSRVPESHHTVNHSR